MTLASGQVASVPKANLSLDLNLAEERELSRAELETALQRTYGSKARVLVDGVADNQASSSMRKRRVQQVKCRVMFDDVGEARAEQARGASRRAEFGTAMGLDVACVEPETADKMDVVDAVTLKLDSDSSHILCGACLAYNGRGECEKVVCYTDRAFAGSAVRHSGDTQVDGKSVHTIGMVLSRLPEDVTQLYFTICSCGPSDLSGFKHPSIMLYHNAQPDANLLEYSIGQAAQSASCVIARMLRQPAWTHDDRARIARTLRKLRLPLLCLDLCLAMAEESTWSIQALGTEEWHLPEKVCSNYHSGQQLIEANLARGTSVETQAVGVGAGSGPAASVASV